MSLIETNAAKLRDMHAAIHKTSRSRRENENKMRAWKQACAGFHSSYDRLAFPGGLERAMSLVAKKDPGIIEEVVLFLEADPFFFRSGYIKAKFIRHLRNARLNSNQKERLQLVIIARIQEKARREFRWYCRLAKSITSPEFEQRLAELSAAGNLKLISRQAKWVLAQLRPT